jgi:hypothetical protein
LAVSGRVGVIENLRLVDLVAIAETNRPFFEEFEAFLATNGYPSVYAFISAADASNVVSLYLATPSEQKLFDGVGRPYAAGKAKWYFLAWLFRDAPAQRLGPLLRQFQGANILARRGAILEQVRRFVAPLFPSSQYWTWPVVREVMIARLEGSRRALRGSLTEEVVRTALRELFLRHSLALTVGASQVSLHDETYDVQVVSADASLLIPVKSRETMGGGHANLFTRDIHKSITVAHENGYECIPVVIAESWSATLTGLGCEHWIHIECNPNQTDVLVEQLRVELEKLSSVFEKFAGPV